VHLRDDDALGAVDDEGAVVRHERHVAHVDVLLLDVLDRLGAGVGIHVEHDQAQRHLERGREGDAALAALVDVVFRLLEGVAHELQKRRRGEIGDREDRLEDALQPLVGAPAFRLVHHQELVVGRLLNLDEVRHLGDFPDLPEELANALATDQRIGHETSLHHLSVGCPGKAKRLPSPDQEGPPRRTISPPEPNSSSVRRALPPAGNDGRPKRR
jgi:hypothetical protein